MKDACEFPLSGGFLIDSEGSQEVLPDGNTEFLITPMPREVVDGLQADLRELASHYILVRLDSFGDEILRKAVNRFCNKGV